MAQQQSLAIDLFEDMGRKVAEADAQGDEDGSRVVDEIESMCMNCHEDVCSHSQPNTCLADTRKGYHTASSH
jgi:hypothetical protein